jgi:hypothetical protein
MSDEADGSFAFEMAQGFLDRDAAGAELGRNRLLAHWFRGTKLAAEDGCSQVMRDEIDAQFRGHQRRTVISGDGQGFELRSPGRLRHRSAFVSPTLATDGSYANGS